MAVNINSNPNEPPRKNRRKDDVVSGALSKCKEVAIPDEILDYIFDYATDNPARREWEAEGPVDLPPFDKYLSEKREQLVTEAIRTKSSISLVSSRWRRASARFLYEDILIRQGSLHLATKLESSYSASRTFGHLVRRATMGVDMRVTWVFSLEPGARRILLACPKLVSLVRRNGLKFRESDLFDKSIRRPMISDVQLPNLRRLEWDHAPVTSAAEIPEFFYKSGKLEVVSLANTSPRRGVFSYALLKFPWSSIPQGMEGDALAVANIRTLRLDCAVSNELPAWLVHFGPPRPEVTLTALNRLIFHTPAPQIDGFIPSYWSKYASQLRTVELSVPVLDFIKYMDSAWRTWKRVLMECSNLEHLHCHISNFPFEHQGRQATNTSVREVMIHAGKEDIGACRELTSMSCFSESLIRICEDRTYLSSLQRVKFHGSGWQGLIGDGLRVALAAAALRGNIEIMFVDTDL